MTLTAAEQIRHAESSRAATPALSGRRTLARVVIATINRAEGETGVHQHTRMLAAGLRDAGVACDVVSAHDAGPLYLGVFAVRRLLLDQVNRTWGTRWYRHWHTVAAAVAQRRHLKQHGEPDVMIAQCTRSARAALGVRREAGATYPIVLVCHFNESEAAEHRAKGELAGEDNFRAVLDFENRVLSEVDHVVYVSHWARRGVEQARQVQTRGATVISNGVEAAPATDSPLTRRDLGLSDDDLVLTNIGTLEPRKNQLELLTLFATLRGEYPASRLLLVGDGPQRREVEQAVMEHKLEDAVKLLGHRRDVPAILGLTDLYVHYATLENCPLSIIESARAGVPFAAVPTGGVPELQAAFDCRFELSPHDHRGSIEAIRGLLESAADRRAAGQRARERFNATFTRDAMTRRYIDVLSSLAATEARA
jgi:glycosyltransferase involved in cell wall biosynthesis